MPSTLCRTVKITVQSYLASRATRVETPSLEFVKSIGAKVSQAEAAYACLEIARNHGEVQVVTASASPDNQGSLKVLEKVGFTFLGMKWFEDTEQDEPSYEYHF